MSTIICTYHSIQKWLKLVSLIDYYGRKLCKEIIHQKEGLPYDGRELCIILKKYEDELQFEGQKKIICPSNGITDERKFDISLYVILIKVLFTPKYDDLAKSLRRLRNELHHTAVRDMSDQDFEKQWNNVLSIFKEYEFTECEDLENLDLFNAVDLDARLANIKLELQGII